MRIRRLRKPAAALEVTAFINVIVVLVPFLLSTAVFTRLSVIELSLPAQNSSLRAALTTNKAYIDRLMEVSDRLGSWITAAQAAGALNPALPPEVILYTLFARACDPVPGFLKAAGQLDDAQIVELMLRICFDGLRGRAG